MKNVRIIAGIVVSPLVMALITSLLAIGTPSFLQGLLFAFVFYLVLFVVLGGISHLFLRWKQWHTLRQYLGVMFLVATTIFFALRICSLLWIFGNGGSEFHLGTQVIEEGHFTFNGVVLTIFESMFTAVLFCGSFALFWLIAVRVPHGRDDIGPE